MFKVQRSKWSHHVSSFEFETLGDGPFIPENTTSISRLIEKLKTMKNDFVALRQELGASRYMVRFILFLFREAVPPCVVVVF